MFEVATTGVTKIYSYVAGTYYFSTTFGTRDAWPSSLPGSAA